LAIALLAVTFLILLFPPFSYDVEGRIVARQWHFFFNSQRILRDNSLGFPGRVDLAMLSLEFLLAAVPIGALYYLFGMKKGEDSL
jgi:hypothetical protein